MSIALHPSAPFRQIGAGETRATFYAAVRRKAAADVSELAG
jgi:hypothetical protein